MTSRFSGLRWTLPIMFVASATLAAACASDGGGAPGTGGRGSGGSGTGTGGAGTGGNGTGGSGTGGSGTGGAATGGSSSGTGGATSTGGTGVGTGGAGTGGAGTGGAASGGSVGSGGAGTGGSASGGASGGTGGAGGGGRGGANSGGTGGGSATGGAGGGSGMFTLTTPAFMNQPGCAANMATSCANFPRENTNPSNISPAMTWTGAPAGTQSFAVVLQDLTNMNAHWILWNIPVTVTSLAANVSRASAMPPMPAGSQQASIASGAMGDGYFGPGACGNVYEFLVYALSVPTFTPTMPTDHTMVRAQLRALGNSILGTASIRGRGYAGNCP